MIYSLKAKIISNKEIASNIYESYLYAPEIAKISKEIGALTVGIVTKPFAFEGPIRKKRALEGIKEMKKNCEKPYKNIYKVLLVARCQKTGLSKPSRLKQLPLGLML